MDALRPYAVQQQWQDRHYWWHTVSTVADVEYDVDRIPPGSTILGELNAGDDVVDALGVFDLPPNMTVLGKVVISQRLRIPENLTVCGILEIERHGLWVHDDDDDYLTLPESLHVDKEIRIDNGSDIARPIPTHLRSIIKIARMKLTGRSFETMQLVETEEGLRDDDEGPEPSMGMR